MTYEDSAREAKRGPIGSQHLRGEVETRIAIHATLETIAERLHAEGVLDVPGLRRFYEELKEAGL